MIVFLYLWISFHCWIEIGMEEIEMEMRIGLSFLINDCGNLIIDLKIHINER